MPKTKFVPLARLTYAEFLANPRTDYDYWRKLMVNDLGHENVLPAFDLGRVTVAPSKVRRPKAVVRTARVAPGLDLRYVPRDEWPKTEAPSEPAESPKPHGQAVSPGVVRMDRDELNALLRAAAGTIRMADID